MKRFYIIAMMCLVTVMGHSPTLQAQTVWDGTTDISWYDASQTSFDISTPEQLAGLAALVNTGTSFNGKTLNLVNDIWLNADNDSTNNWVPIGGGSPTAESPSTGNAFKGHFNGHGYAIYNLYCDKGNTFHAGLFCALENPCTIDSLVMVNPVLKSRGMMGCIAGYPRGSSSVYIRYCLVINARIEGVNSSGSNNIGGIVGATYPNSGSTYIQNCGVTGSITGYYPGGMAGNAERSYITNAYFAGTLFAYGTNYGGMTAHGGDRTNCYSYTQVLSSTSQSSASNDGTPVTQAEMQSDSMITLLGDAFMLDNGVNNGYPIMSYMAGIRPAAVNICQNESVTLTAFGYDSYVWSTGATTESITVSPSTTTTYTVTGYASNGVTASHTSTVTVYPQAVVNATVAASSDGLVHATVTPETATATCGTPEAVTFTVYPDNNWRVASVYMNGTQVYGEFTYGPATITVMSEEIVNSVVINMTDALTCTGVQNLSASNIYGTNATVSWNAHTTGELADYHIVVYEVATGIMTEYTTTDLSYMVTGLSENTSYQIGVYTFCTDGYGSDTVYVNITTPCVAPIEAVNNSYPTSTYTTEGNHFPMSNHYLNSFTEQIYLPGDFNNISAEFSGMSFQYNDASQITRTLDIYMAHTADAVFTENVWATPIGDYVHVYSGPVVFNRNGTDRWVNIAFDTNFYYNGSDNLLLVVNDITGSEVNNSNAKFYTVNTNTNRSQCKYTHDANDNWSITNMPTSGTLHTQVNNIRLTACDVVSCIVPNTVTLGTVDDYSAELSWYNPNASQNCEIEYKAEGDADWTSTGSFSGSDYTIYGLNANTQYQARVRAICGSNSTSEWTGTVSFRTECEPIINLPYTQNFAGSDVYGSGNDQYVYCWDRYASNPSEPVFINNSSAAHSASKCLKFYDGSNMTTIAIMPKVDESISLNQLQISYWVRRTQSSNVVFELGVMTDKNDPTTFEVVDTPALGDWTLEEYSFENYTGYGQYIAFRVTQGNGGDYMRLDDITLDYIPVCQHPVDLVVDATTSETVDIHWTEPGYASTWYVEYGPTGFTPGEGTMETSYDTFYTIYGLNPNTEYDVYVWGDCGGLESTSIDASFRTDCGPIAQLPYTEDFETGIYSTTQDNYIICWDRFASDPAHYVYVPSNSYAHSGTHFLDFHHTTNCYNIAIAPELDQSFDVSQLMVNFWACRTGSSGTLEVGVMTDKSNDSTFVPVDTIDLSMMNTYAYKEQFVSLSGYQGTGKYIAFRVSYASSCGFYIDDVTIDYEPSCSPISSLAVSDITGSSAMVSWTPGPFGTVDSYTVEYSEAGMENWTTSDNITDNPYLLGGLDFSTDYDLRVRPNCADLSTGDWVTTSFRTKCLVGGDFTIGDGTATNSYLPSYCFYNYSYTQQLFLASEIGSPRSIESVTFEKVAGSVNRTYKIYLMHTTETSGANWIDASTATLVFDTAQTLQNGLNTFTFSQPFEYNGTDNLLLIVLDMTGSYASGNTWRTHTAPFTASRYIYQDASAYSTSAIPSSGNGGSTTSRNNVIFGAACDNSTCAAPSLNITNPTSDGATVNWVAGYQESAWEMEYRPASDTNWVSMGTVTSMSEVITGLMPNTAYVVRMRSDCGGGEYSYWTEASFTTACGAFTVTETTPWTEDFETNTTMACFEAPVTYTNSSGSTYPKMLLNYGVAAHSGGNSAEFKGTSNMLVLPEFTNDIHDLRMSFWATSWGVTTTAVVGVITDLADTTTFEVLGDAGTPGPRGSSNSTGNGNFMGPFDFNNVQATSGRIAILFTGTTASDAGWNLDDFTVEIIPSCAAPAHTSVTVDNVNENSAEISFTDEDPSHTSWIIYYGEAGTTTDTWNSTNVNSTTGNILSGLNANTTYGVYVKTLCGGVEGEDQTTTVTFTTTTVPATLPYTTDFEDVNDNPQWVLLNGTQTNQWYIGATTDSTSSVNTTLDGTNGLYISNNGGASNTYSGSESHVYAYRDIFVPDGTTELLLSFDWKAQGGLYNYEFLRVYWLDPSVVTLSAGSNPPSVNGVNYDAAGQPGNYGPSASEHWLSLQNTWQHKEMLITADQFTGMGSGDRTYRLVFHWRNTYYSSQPPAAVDNIELRAITCATPTALTVSNVDQNSATVSWTGNADSYAVTITSVYGTDYQTTTNNTLQLTGLTSNSTYQVTVRGYCGADSSMLSSALTFTTACGALTIDATNPWFENFESYTSSELVCWATPITHTASNGNVYPRAYLNYGEAAHSGTNTVEFKGANNMLVLPEFTNDIHDLRMSFWSTHWGVTTTVAVGVVTDVNDPTTFELLGDAGIPGNRGSSAGGNGNYMGPFDFNGVQATSGRIALLFTGTTTSDAGWNLDDFTVSLIPACAAPAYNSVVVTNVTENSAEVSFVDNNTAHNAWAIYYGAEGTPTSTWNSVNVTSMSGNIISGLNASTTYGVYVVTLCDGVPGDDQTNVATFTTACGPISVAVAPWTTGLEGTDEQILNCWVSASTGYRNGHTYPHIEGTASIAHGGSSALEVAFGDIVTALPLFVEDLSMLQVSFWAYNNNWSSDNAVLELGYMTDPYDSSTFVSLQSLTDQSYAQTTRTFADLAGLNLPTTTRIAFRYIRPSSLSLTSWYIDDLEVSLASTPTPCDVPTGLAVNSITQISAVATWTAGGSETAWNVQYKAASATNWTPATVNTTSFTMSGLTPNTPYQVRVQADCGNGSTSLWTEAATFTTLPDDTPEPCDVPTGLTVSAVTDESITITWDDNTNVDSWNIQYSAAGGALNSTTSNTNSYTINGLQPETAYSVQVQANCSNGNVSEWSSAVTGTTTTGIDSWLANSVSLYPNPAKEYVDIRVDGELNVKMMEVYDVYGKLINTVNVIENPARLNVSGLANGMYFVRVTTEEGVVTKTFVKK